MRVSESQLNVCEQSPTIFRSNLLRWAHSSADGLRVEDSAKTKVQLAECKLNYPEKNRNREVTSSTMKNQLSYKVCIHHKVPLRFITYVVFLDKTLCISLTELVEGRRNVQLTLHRSTLTCRLGAPSGCKSTTDKRLAKTNEGYGRGKVDMLGCETCSVGDICIDHWRSPLSKHQSNKAGHPAPVCGVNTEANESGVQRSSASLGLLSFREPTTLNTKAGNHKGNADEAALSAQRNFRHRKHSSRIGPGMDSITFRIEKL